MVAAGPERYASFRYLLLLASRSGQNNVVGGFNDVSGLEDEMKWNLIGSQPSRWTGLMLAAKGAGEVAMEELHLVAERIDLVDVTGT